MLPLAATQNPDSPEALAKALTEGLARYGISPREVLARGKWPALETLRLDLTGARVTRAQRLPVAPATAHSDFAVSKFELLAKPASFEQTPIEVSIEANQAAFGFAKDKEQQRMLVLTGAAEGELSIEIAREALEKLLQSFGNELAQRQGVEIRKTKLVLTAHGPRALSFRAEVTAKMMIVSAVLAVSGEVDVNDQLEVRLSKLRFDGEGMLASLAGGFIRPQLEKFEGRAFPLMAFFLGAIKLRDLRIGGGNSLRLTAQFDG